MHRAEKCLQGDYENRDISQVIDALSANMDVDITKAIGDITLAIDCLLDCFLKASPRTQGGAPR